MKLNNHTELPDRFVRQAVSWVCRQLDVRVRALDGQSVNLRISRSGGGCSYSAAESVMLITFEHGQPLARRVRHLVESLAWCIGRAVAITDVAWHTRSVIHEFDKRPSGLMDDWSLNAGPRSSAVDDMVDTHLEYLEASDPAVKAAKRAERLLRVMRRRQAKVRARLVEWERKRKLANTKVKKYRAKVAYYEKKLDADRTDAASGS